MTPVAHDRRPAGAFRFRVSDSAAVPLRGQMLRLKVIDGSPSMKDLKPGARLTVTSPSGESGSITVLSHATMAGRASQSRLERTRELDVIIRAEDAAIDGRTIGIGWFVTGP